MIEAKIETEMKIILLMPMFPNEKLKEIYGDLADLRSIYGKDANNFPPGAIGVFSYLNKIAFGLKHFAALNRKFDINYLDRTDLIPLTREANELLKGDLFGE